MKDRRFTPTNGGQRLFIKEVPASGIMYIATGDSDETIMPGGYHTGEDVDEIIRTLQGWRREHPTTVEGWANCFDPDGHDSPEMTFYSSRDAADDGADADIRTACISVKYVKGEGL